MVLSRKEKLSECQKILKYKFESLWLLDKALTHSSSKSKETPSNERLEFLGDAILGLVVSEYLFRSFPHFNEGELTGIKSEVVSSKSLVKCSKALRLDQYICVGKGISTRRFLPSSVAANAFEAVIGAVFLDGGLERAREFVLRNISEQMINVLQNQDQTNHKSVLQQISQKHFACTPVYRVIREKGPDHVKSFEVVAVIRGEEYPSAWGRSKKEAEQKAAKKAIQKLKKEPNL